MTDSDEPDRAEIFSFREEQLGFNESVNDIIRRQIISQRDAVIPSVCRGGSCRAKT